MAERSSLNSFGQTNTAPFLSLVESYQRYYADGQGHTARAKRLDLQKFTQFLCKYRAVSKPEKLKSADWDFSSVQSFVEDSLRSGESPATVARRLATIKHMGRTLSDKLPGFTNPAKEVKTPSINAPRPQALSRAELDQIRSKAEGRISERDSFIRYRNQVLFLFLIDTGIRAEEVRLLRVSQLDDNLEWIKNVRTKGRRFRNVYITSEMRQILGEYLERREVELLRIYEKLPKTDSKKLPLFISTYDAAPADPDSFLMGAKTIWRAVNELSAGEKLHPHLLRHSYAIELLDESKDIRLVAQALGHSDVRITMRYTERQEHEVAKALEKTRAVRRVKKH